jgi:hypothetical protein
MRYRSLLLAMAILLADAAGCSYLGRTRPNGKISVQVVSWPLVKKLAEPNAGIEWAQGDDFESYRSEHNSLENYG